MPRPLAELVGISKSFGPTMALSDVSLDLYAGEVHVIAGENGAGKSTLIRILAGAHSDYSGSIVIAGEPVRLRTPEAAAQAGIATIHQELSLVGSMSIADNLLLGEAGSSMALVSPKRRARAAAEILELLELPLDPSWLVESLPLSLRQLVEIARALARRARIIIMDEPTSALSQPEAEALFRHIERLRARGAGIIYISHRMEEIYRLADRITVLRDGQLVTTAAACELGPELLIEKMVGRSLKKIAVTRRSASSQPVLGVEHLTLTDPRRAGSLLVDDVSFTLNEGEILGLAGLRGSGISDLLQALFGASGKIAHGRLSFGTREFCPSGPRQALDEGLMLLSNDRATSVVLPLSVLHNATLSSISRGRNIVWHGRRERSAVHELAREVRLIAPSLDAPAASLSGGNQQKLALMRCLLAKPRVLLLDEPTRGIDVGAKSDIYEIIMRLAASGVAMLLVASELEELLALADRILVMSRGKIAASLSRQQFARERIIALAMGEASKVAAIG